MDKKRYGYIQCIDTSLNINSLILKMESLGITRENIYIDESWQRTQFDTLFSLLNTKDEILIDSISSLGKNYLEMNRLWQYITKEKDINILALDFPLMDNTQSTFDKSEKSIMEIAFAFMCYVRQTEKRIAKLRQKQGIEEARRNGVIFGRKSLDVPEDFESVFQDWSNEQISTRRAALLLNVDFKTFKKWANQKSKELQTRDNKKDI